MASSKSDSSSALAKKASRKRGLATKVSRKVRSRKESNSSESDGAWTCNEGESTENDEETPAHEALRGQTALVTASCPRKYPRTIEARRKKRVMIPEDFSTADFLKFRRVVNTTSNVTIEKATCHDEPHKRFRKSLDRRERHKHTAIKASGTFAHKKIADAFQREHGLRISFSFKQKRFVGNLTYLMEPGKKPSTDVDLNPATYPAHLDVKEEMAAHKHPTDVEPKTHKKRKRLSFDEVSNVIIEGVGQGPLKTRKALEQAAKKLKTEGKVELWNFLGDLKTAADVSALLSKVWRLWGENAHHMFRTKCEYPLKSFRFNQLRKVTAGF